MTSINERNKNFNLAMKNFMKGNCTKLESNNDFIIFSEKLKEYFFKHNMPAQFDIINEERLYTFNDTVKLSKSTIKIFDENICNITILPINKGGVELYRLEMYKIGSGLGSIFMNAINEVSKETGIIVYMIPGDPGNNIQGDDQKRRNFYHKFGFKRLSTSKYWSNHQIVKKENIESRLHIFNNDQAA
jgi:hypothetical protein